MKDNIDDKIIENMERKKDKQRSKKKRKTEEASAFQSVFDKYTYENIEKIRRKGVIDRFIGILSAGKEANVYFAISPEDEPLAIKIYKIDPNNTRWMKSYIYGDPRFYKIGSSTHKIIYTWARKEYKNLKRMSKHSIEVPKPIFILKNLLVMEFIGEKNGTPAPRLKDVEQVSNPEMLYNEILDYIWQMFVEAKLVHGDLSEFNILYYKKKPVIIDVSQAVSIEHPKSLFFLTRDVKNIMKYFRKIIPNYDFPNEKNIIEDIYRSAFHKNKANESL